MREASHRVADRREAVAALVGELAVAAGDPSVLLPLAARRLSEVFGHLSLVRLLSTDGQYIEAGDAIHHADPKILAIAKAAAAGYPRRVGEGILGHVAATGKSVLMPVVDRAALLDGFDPEGQALVEQLGITSLVVAPMIAEGRTIGVVGVTSTARERPFDATDLTAIEDTAARLAMMVAAARAAASRSLLAAIVQSSNDAIVSKRLDGTITSWNAAAERLFGYAPEEAVGKPIALIIPPNRLEEEKKLLACVAAGEPVSHYETIRRHKDGSDVHVSLSLAPILDSSGKVIGASKTARDLGAQHKAAETLRRTEEQLRHAQKMEAVGRLAGGIAHDFNNLLSVILSYSEMVLEDLETGDPTAADVGEIRRAAVAASDLTRQLLVFSRQQVVEPKVLDLNQILGGMGKMLRRILGEDIELTCVPRANLGRIRADPSNVEQVIMNLVVNARDAMPTGGKLTIEASNVGLDADYAREHLGSKAGPHVMLAVTDTGSGMDAATQARIFEPFFTTKAVGKGSGLGLSTVFGIAQQCGGSVWVYSELGKGTTVKVYFPRVEATLDTPRAAQAPSAHAGSETILLVEDQAQVRNVAAGILKRNGYRVIIAENAGEALLFCEMHPGKIHLLLTDVVMPQMGGAELAARLASMRPEMKLLCMSGYTDDSVVRHGALDSGIAFLQKPFTPESLTRRVRDVLSTSPRHFAQ